MEWFFKRVRRLGVFGFFLIAELSAQPKTNLEQLTFLADSLVRDFEFQLDSTVTHLALKPIEPQHELNWLFEKILFDGLANSDRTLSVWVSGRSGAVAPEIFIVEFRPITASIQYRETELQSRLARVAEIALFLRLLTPMQDFISQTELRNEKVDTIAKQDVPSLEDTALDFTVGRMQKRNRQIRLFKPFVMAAAAGSVVYLFFSLRSR